MNDDERTSQEGSRPLTNSPGRSLRGADLALSWFQAIEESERLGETEELRDRVEAKRKKIEARVSELKADARSEAREESQKLEAKLGELRETVKGGWENMTEAIAGKLNKWLKD